MVAGKPEWSSSLRRVLILRDGGGDTAADLIMEFVIVDFTRGVDINAHLRKYEFSKRNIMEAFLRYLLWALEPGCTSCW